MKWLILSVILLVSCKKDEKFLMSGMWTIDKVITNNSGSESIDRSTQVVFNDNGTYSYSGKPDGIYLIGGKKIYLNGFDDGYDFNSSKTELIIKASLNPLSDPAIAASYTTYLSKN